MFIPISKVCEILGVSLSTVYQMLKRGVLKESFRTEGKHRRFNSPPFGPRVFYVHDIHQLQRKTYEPRVVTYARVSSHDQKQDLVRQSTTLHAKALQLGYKSIQQIEDLGSGLNYKKKGFVKLLDLIFNHEFEILIVNHKDR